MKKVYTERIRSGFTLIELLVVIAIIGILASIVMVGITNVRARAQDTRVKSDMSVAQKEAAMCLNEGKALTLNPVGPSVSDQICLAHQNWPDLSVNGKGTGSAPWAYNTTDIINQNDTFRFSATNGTITFVCQENGCQEANQ